jgi:DNA primase
MLSISQRRSLARASKAYHEQLMSLSASDPDGVIAYLRSRNLSYAVAQKYMLGVVQEPLNGDERFLGRLAIPYLSPAGCVGMTYRAINDDTPKYLRPHGQKTRLYNADAYFHATDAIGVAEGELDALCATEFLGVPTLGVPGASNWRSEWDHLFRDFSTVFIWQDGDEAGMAFGALVADKVGWRARIVQCEPGEDVNSMIVAGKDPLLRQLATTEAS